MKTFIIWIFLVVQTAAYASDKSWYVIEKFECTISNGVTVTYTSKRATEVKATIGIFSKSFYVDKFSYSENLNTTCLDFSTQAMSSDLAKSSFVTSYSIRFTGFLPVENKDQSVAARVYTNVASTGWVLLPNSAYCDIDVQQIF